MAAKNPITAKHCTCGRTIRSFNQSGLCEKCNKEDRRLNMKNLRKEFNEVKTLILQMNEDLLLHIKSSQ